MSDDKPQREENYTELGALIGTIAATISTLVAASAITPPVLITSLVVSGACGVAYILQRGWVKAARAKRDSGCSK